MYHQRPTLATIFRIDSSLEGDGEGSESRSPRDKLVSLDGDFPYTLGCCALVEEFVKAEKAVDGVPLATEVEGLEDVVEEDEAEDLTITPVTGIRTPCVGSN